jgi:hypothetical protein
MSSAGGGAVGGYSVPLGSTSGKKRKSNSIIRQENIDLNIIEQVMKLITEGGILK